MVLKTDQYQSYINLPTIFEKSVRALGGWGHTPTWYDPVYMT